MPSRNRHPARRPADLPSLVPAGKLAGQPTIHIKRRVTLIGDSAAAHLKLMSPFIAKAQALIVADGDTITLADLYADGTVQVNGRPARESTLHHSDTVWI